jgi:hypothetical protein
MFIVARELHWLANARVGPDGRSLGLRKHAVKHVMDQGVQIVKNKTHH